MASIFPELLNYSQLAPVIIRIACGFSLARMNAPKIKGSGAEKYLAILEILGAIFVLIGFLTQPAAIVLIAIIAAEIIRKQIRKTEILPGRKIIYLLLISSLLSLLVAGPGLFSIDLPL